MSDKIEAEANPAVAPKVEERESSEDERSDDEKSDEQAVTARLRGRRGNKKSQAAKDEEGDAQPADDANKPEDDGASKEASDVAQSPSKSKKGGKNDKAKALVDPTFAPRAGRFFMHDDRSSSRGGRGSARVSTWSRKDAKDDLPWSHDKFEEINAPREQQSARRGTGRGGSRGGHSDYTPKNSQGAVEAPRTTPSSTPASTTSQSQSNVQSVPKTEKPTSTPSATVNAAPTEATQAEQYVSANGVPSFSRGRGRGRGMGRGGLTREELETRLHHQTAPSASTQPAGQQTESLPAQQPTVRQTQPNQNQPVHAQSHAQPQQQQPRQQQQQSQSAQQQHSAEAQAAPKPVKLDVNAPVYYPDQPRPQAEDAGVGAGKRYSALRGPQQPLRDVEALHYMEPGLAMPAEYLPPQFQQQFMPHGGPQQFGMLAPGQGPFIPAMHGQPQFVPQQQFYAPPPVLQQQLAMQAPMYAASYASQMDSGAPVYHPSHMQFYDPGFVSPSRNADVQYIQRVRQQQQAQQAQQQQRPQQPSRTLMFVHPDQSSAAQ